MLKNEALIREVFRDEEFVKKLLVLETPEEVQTTLQEQGIAISIEEIQETREFFLKNLNSGKELSEAELAEVQGGCVVFTSLAIFLGTLAGAAIAGAVGGVIAAGTIGGAVVMAINNVKW